MRRFALVLLAIFGLFGCPPTGLTNTCHFEGESTTSCGQCIRGKCQTVIDAECVSIIRDDATLAALDTCASDHGCEKLASSLSNIWSCVENACSLFCPLTATAATLDGGTDVVCTQADDACGCGAASDAGSPSTSSCSPTDVGGRGICCASSTAWATTPQGACTCYPIACRQDPNGFDSGATCVCGAYQSLGTSEKVDLCNGTTCCTSDTKCECYETRRTCPSGESPTLYCSTMALRLTCDASSEEAPRCL